MMPRLQIANQRRYWVVDDDMRSFVALVAGRVFSAETNTPLSTFQVIASRDDLAITHAADGVFAVAGYPSQLFPDLAMQPYQFDLTISTAKHRGATLTVNVPMAAQFPLPELAVLLPFQPIRLQGRITLATTGAAIANASVTVNEANTITLRAPLVRDYAIGSAAQACTIAPVGAARLLTESARAGATELVLDSSAGLVANDLLQLGTPVWHTIVIVAGAGTVPNSLRLQTALTRSYSSGSTFQPISATLAAPTRNLVADATLGDGLLRLDGTLNANAIRLNDGVQASFYYLNALSDTAGYYRLDGIGGQATVTVLATTATHDLQRTWFIDPRLDTNRVDFALTPL
jgi:hypothetical protein